MRRIAAGVRFGLVRASTGRLTIDSSSIEHDGATSAGSPPPVRRRAATLINLVYQYAGVALTVVRGIVMVPIFLRFIPIDLYGAWMASGDVIAWVLLTEAGTADLIRQQVAQHYGASDLRGAGRAFGAGMCLSALLAAMVAAIGLAIAPAAPAWVNYQGEHAGELSTAVLMAVFATALGILCGALRGAQQGLQRPLGVGIVGIAAEALSIATSIGLLLWGFGLYAIPIGFLVREAVNFAGCLALFGRTASVLRIPVGVERRRVIALAGLTGWTFLSRLGYALGHHLHSFLLARFVGTEWVPMAALTRRAWEILFLLLSRFSFSFQPGLAHLHGSGDASRFVGVVRQMLVALLAACAVTAGLAWALNETFMTLWLSSPEIYAGHAYNALTGVATLLNVALFTLCQVILAAGRIRESAVAQLWPNVANGALLAGGLAASAAAGLAPATILLVIPLSAVVSIGLAGLPYATWHWMSVSPGVSSSAGALAGSAARVLLVSAFAALISAWLIHPASWTMLVLYAALLATALAFASALVDVEVRALGRQALRAATRIATRIRQSPGAGSA